MAEQQLNNRDT